jgi:hypothetical protein
VKPTQGLAFRLAMKHDSSHLGDQYIESTGRKRIHYTRDEFALGVSYQIFEGLRVYGEAGYAYNMGNSQLERPWRLQGGIEYETEPLFWNGLGRLYAALDMVIWPENHYQPTLTFQAGVHVHVESIGRDLRFGVQLYDGRSVIGEFFQYREVNCAFGVWLDL